MEAAVLRVKRKRCADPAEALIISCKRPRAEEKTPESVSTQVFKLAATVISQNEPVQKYVQEAMSRDRATRVHQPHVGSLQRIQKDLRAWKDAERHESRYRLVSSLRPKCGEGDNSQPASPVEERQHVPEEAEASAKEVDSEAGTDEAIQVFDVVQEEAEEEAVDVKASDPESIVCNSVTMIRERLTVSEDGQGSEHRENPEEFVYDLYYAESSPRDWIQDILSVQPYRYEQELMADDGEPDEAYEDEDDENEESNWRNDYPDEEEECSDREERYMGYYEDSDEGAGHGRGHAWDVYRHKALRELESDDEESSD